MPYEANADFLVLNHTTVSKLCLYGEFLSRSFKSVNSIQNYISGVKTLHLLAGIEFPSENWFSVKLLYRGLARENLLLPHRALPITVYKLKLS
jgi:hypothetical protein